MNGNDLRSPLAKVRGLGSAKFGTGHFIVERVTALALVPLSIWFVIGLLTSILGDDSPQAISDWLHSPINATCMALFVVFGFVHSMYGVRVIIEDYISCNVMKHLLLIVNQGMHILLGMLALISVLKLHFMPAAIM